MNEFTEQELALGKVAYDALNAHAATSHPEEAGKAPAFEALEPWHQASFTASALAVEAKLEANRGAAFAVPETE